VEDWVGLTGLKGNFEEMKNDTTKPEAELETMLVEKAGRKNYIAPSVRQEYERALFWEF
jgi:hypothetical protein